MNQGAKQRIVGTVVLLALALIFLPIIFDGQGSYQADLTSRIPEAPIISVLPEPTQTRPEIIADNLDPADAVTAEVADDSGDAAITEPTTDVDQPIQEDTVQISTSEAVFTRETIAFDSAGLPLSWSVRLGSFSNSENARKLLDRLLAAGYKAYERQLASGQRELTAVFVGPWIDRQVVDNYQKQLQEEFQLAGIVVRYEVEQL